MFQFKKSTIATIYGLTAIFAASSSMAAGPEQDSAKAPQKDPKNLVIACEKAEARLLFFVEPQYTDAVIKITGSWSLPINVKYIVGEATAGENPIQCTVFVRKEETFLRAIAPRSIEIKSIYESTWGITLDIDDPTLERISCTGPSVFKASLSKLAAAIKKVAPNIDLAPSSNPACTKPVEAKDFPRMPSIDEALAVKLLKADSKSENDSRSKQDLPSEPSGSAASQASAQKAI